MSELKDALLREFAQSTQPQLDTTPAAQASAHASGATAIAINGDHNVVHWTPGQNARQLPDDTLGRILTAARPVARSWVRIFGVLACGVMLMRVVQVYAFTGSLAAASAWLDAHDPWLPAKVVGFAAINATVLLALRSVWRPRRR